MWGPVDLVASPYLVLPLAVEPTKPRLCHDERYLNLWIRDLPFKLNHLCDLPRYVLPHPLPDDLRRQEWLSAHVVFLISGLFWLSVAGILFPLPYSSIWVEGQCIYHKLVLEVSGAARSIGVPVSQYIDKRHMGQLFTAPLRTTRGPSFQ